VERNIGLGIIHLRLEGGRTVLMGEKVLAKNGLEILSYDGNNYDE
jgi:hypothetical protein